MSSFSIKQRHLFIIAAVLLGSCLSGFINVWSLQRLSDLELVRSSYLKLEVKLLNLRRNEKDFLARKDTKYVAKFNDNYQKSVHILDLLHDTEALAGLAVDQEVSPMLSTYHKAFNDLAVQQQTIGLHSKDGLYGGLRASIHKVEGMIQGQPELLVDMLMLRRHEKDFMLRSNEKYLSKYNHTMDQLVGNLMSFL